MYFCAKDVLIDQKGEKRCRSEKWGKKIQAAAYNGAHTVVRFGSNQSALKKSLLLL